MYFNNKISINRCGAVVALLQQKIHYCLVLKSDVMKCKLVEQILMFLQVFRVRCLNCANSTSLFYHNASQQINMLSDVQAYVYSLKYILEICG